ncbi:FMN-binding protein [Parasporobacterium paucivorans]|uniref:Ion-translocating oxidoreductase complex subunit G n=1 Tax=Parasporobacterium paucivorans DSM 15970 TaxID=1122934 RepID=A0A1M6ADG7_9FIRM|nr:FMN-binding protein [Parasporobacterium paucivorans]SHI34358.1 electron transport complex protein RnfG [Parasporobacterium paucivorans DSM 15970]
MSEKKKMIKNALILFAITLVAGLFLGLVYEVTKIPRANQIAKKQQEAYKTVFQDAQKFSVVDFNAADVAGYLAEKGLSQSMEVIDGVILANDDSGNPLGYVINVTTKEGYAGNIVFSVGIKNDGTVNAISMLSIAETAGLGMKAKEPAFKDQFANKNVDSFAYTKSGAVQENEIDAISGSTITTNAVTNGVNAAIYCFDYLTGGGSVE